jgi:hypothetical protein
VSDKLTVGHLRRVIEGLPDDTIIRPDWQDGPPQDHEPGVELFGFEAERGELLAKVGLFYLDEVEDEG